MIIPYRYCVTKCNIDHGTIIEKLSTKGNKFFSNFKRSASTITRTKTILIICEGIITVKSMHAGLLNNETEFYIKTIQ